MASKATFVTRGYGQVEPNHLSAQRTGQIYAQLPAASTIDQLENGQFVKYDYKAGVVNFEGAGEWMLVFNEVKVYHDGQGDADFAMIKDNYGAKVYSVHDGAANLYNGRDFSGAIAPKDPYVVDSTDAPFIIEQYTVPAEMPDNTTMVPRVFKTNIGDIFTTNTIKATELAVGDELVVGNDGYLTSADGENIDNAGDMKWQVVKVYTLADRQKAVKIMRIA